MACTHSFQQCNVAARDTSFNSPCLEIKDVMEVFLVMEKKVLCKISITLAPLYLLSAFLFLTWCILKE